MKNIKETAKTLRMAFLSIVVVALVIFAMNFSTIFQLGEHRETSVSAVLERIKQIAQLDTVEMHFNEILDYRSAITINDIELPFTEKTFIFVVKAKVQSGIDLSTLMEEDILIDGQKITLTLAKATITSKEVLEYKAYAEKDGLFNPVTNEDTLATLNDFQNRLEEQALENGILEKAETNARLVLENLLLMIGFEEIVIRFE